jgi:hypothetical protein
MIANILIGLVVIIGAFLGYVAMQSSDMNIGRELLINAKPEAIFPYINNNKKTNEWMPWGDTDPDIHMTYSGPEEGVGSQASWTSSGRMGVGQAVIVASSVNQAVNTKLTYIKPMEMSQDAVISLTPKGDSTLVRWEVKGKNTFIGRMFCVFMDMDKVVGSQFIKGLTNLKNIVENNQR